jgi:hypothetical protein
MQATGWSQGDFNDDGIVDGADYTIWADHYFVPAGTSSVMTEENSPSDSPSTAPSAAELSNAPLNSPSNTSSNALTAEPTSLAMPTPIEPTIAIAPRVATSHRGQELAMAVQGQPSLGPTSSGPTDWLFTTSLGAACPIELPGSLVSHDTTDRDADRNSETGRSRDDARLAAVDQVFLHRDDAADRLARAELKSAAASAARSSQSRLLQRSWLSDAQVGDTDAEPSHADALFSQDAQALLNAWNQAPRSRNVATTGR